VGDRLQGKAAALRTTQSSLWFLMIQSNVLSSGESKTRAQRSTGVGKPLLSVRVKCPELWIGNFVGDRLGLSLTAVNDELRLTHFSDDAPLFILRWSFLGFELFFCKWCRWPAPVRHSGLKKRSRLIKVLRLSSIRDNSKTLGANHHITRVVCEHERATGRSTWGDVASGGCGGYTM